jgi:hypothetical protein
LDGQLAIVLIAVAGRRPVLIAVGDRRPLAKVVIAVAALSSLAYYYID